MKRVIFSAILFAGSVAFANAQFTSNYQPIAMEQSVYAEEFKEIQLKDLNQQIQEAVKAIAGETLEVKKVEFDAEKEVAKITFANKADKSESSIVLDKTGKEVK